MELKDFLQQIAPTVLMAIAGAALRFIQKIQADIRDLTVSTKELHFRLLHATETIDKFRDTLSQHDKRITKLEKEF